MNTRGSSASRSTRTIATYSSSSSTNSSAVRASPVTSLIRSATSSTSSAPSRSSSCPLQPAWLRASTTAEYDTSHLPLGRSLGAPVDRPGVLLTDSDPARDHAQHLVRVQVQIFQDHREIPLPQPEVGEDPQVAGGPDIVQLVLVRQVLAEQLD